MGYSRPENQRPVLQNYISAENFTDKFSSSNLGQNSTSKKQGTLTWVFWTLILDFKVILKSTIRNVHKSN
jgi:hypothetical protein